MLPNRIGEFCRRASTSTSVSPRNACLHYPTISVRPPAGLDRGEMMSLWRRSVLRQDVLNVGNQMFRHDDELPGVGPDYPNALARSLPAEPLIDCEEEGGCGRR